MDRFYFPFKEGKQIVLRRLTKGLLAIQVIAMTCFFASISLTLAYPENDIIQAIEKKQKELENKEALLKKEEERLGILRKDLEEKIQKYTEILIQIEKALKELDKIKEERLNHVVKLYESMPPEEAAIKLSALDEETAVTIILNMKSKKAGSILALIESQKAATITKRILNAKEAKETTP
ncbi:MAG: hypothetical protein KatS3mg078_0109 [Deltaproteobacteria bacterium]|nr:MAG: hypothetical protein KatS3mg078_0109 [Deltaproteobacteria bacterium]